jgi:cytochrome c-type biogenesis protein
VALVVGLVTGFAAAGSLLGVVASSFAELINSLRYFTIFLLLAIGIISIFPQLGYWLLKYLPFNGLLQRIKHPMDCWGSLFWAISWCSCDLTVCGCSKLVGW